MQKGYRHGDISIGNIMMPVKDVKTEAFEFINPGREASHVIWEDRLVTTLRDLGIADMCHGFVIDGDMAIKIPDYFNQKHGDSRSVRWNLKRCWRDSDCVRRAPVSSYQINSSTRWN